MKAFFSEESYKVSKKKHHLTDYGQQKLLGIGLIAIGIIACIMFPEDAMGGIMAVMLGLCRTLAD